MCSRQRLCAWTILLCLILIEPLALQAQLRSPAQQRGISVGAAVAMSPFRNEAAYTNTLSREFNMLEPEDAMKWEALRPNEKTFSFRDADHIVEFARTHGMKVRGHNLVWGTHNPE